VKGLIGWGWALCDETGSDRGPNGGENLQHAALAALLCHSFTEADAALTSAALSPAGWCPLTYICNVPPSPVCYLFCSLFREWRFFYYFLFFRDCEFGAASSTSTRWSRGLWIINSFVHKWDGSLDVYAFIGGFCGVVRGW
jgi:hypothetical protein